MRARRSKSYYVTGRVNAYAEGRVTAQMGKPLSGNPYPAPTEEFSTQYNHMAAMHKAWRDGWRSVGEIAPR